MQECIIKSEKYIKNKNQIKCTHTINSLNGINHFVLWSGGCDSTLLLYELIEAYGCQNVIAISYQYPWLGENKLKNEEIHRESFKLKLNLKFPKDFMYFRHMVIKVDYNKKSGYENINIKSGGIPQTVAWLLSVPMLCEDNSIIYTGTIKEDDDILFLDNYNDTTTNISKLLRKNLSFQLPYIWFTKEQIIEKLFYYNIYEETWFCETSKDMNSPCKNCIPCITHIKALNSLYNSPITDGFIKYRAKEELDKINKHNNCREGVVKNALLSTT